jgi:hypothetical protein
VAQASLEEVAGVDRALDAIVALGVIGQRPAHPPFVAEVLGARDAVVAARVTVVSPNAASLDVSASVIWVAHVVSAALIEGQVLADQQIGVTAIQGAAHTVVADVAKATSLFIVAVGRAVSGL